MDANRIADGSTFVDNYYALEGFGSAMRGYTGDNPQMGNIVDVLLHPEDLYGQLSLSDVKQDATILFGSHDYPPAWYGQASLQNPNGPGQHPERPELVAAHQFHYGQRPG